VILLSETMLQQTQVDRVVRILGTFRRRFPTIGALAKARKGDVIKGWRGLGYNRRASRLHELAKAIESSARRRLPSSIQELQDLPGIGRYTAHAVAAFAFRQAVPVVDTNVRRVLIRVFPRESQSRDIWTLATMLLPPRSAYDWNQGLMDIGAMICTARGPYCHRCPLRQDCPSADEARHEAKPRRLEPSRDGLPNRIYRGRIIETLRTLNGTETMELARLGPIVKQPFLARDRVWLKQLLAGLERDDLVRLSVRRGSTYVSLPQ
jgi:A/G-specific adenine glycosylase